MVDRYAASPGRLANTGQSMADQDMSTLEGIAGGKHLFGSCTGFTLMELVLATLISSLVVGILSVALTFSLRVWQKGQDRHQSNMPSMMNLLKWQLANYDPLSVTIDGQKKSLFQGDENTLVFTTDLSVKAISKGAPIVAQYLFIKEDKKLYYAEMPFDPYHPEAIQEFLSLKPEKKQTWPVFYSVDVSSFAFGFAAQEQKELATSWDGEDTLPVGVYINWTEEGSPDTMSFTVIPNFFFTKAKPATGLKGTLNQSLDGGEDF